MIDCFNKRECLWRRSALILTDAFAFMGPSGFEESSYFVRIVALAAANMGKASDERVPRCEWREACVQKMSALPKRRLEQRLSSTR